MSADIRAMEMLIWNREMLRPNKINSLFPLSNDSLLRVVMTLDLVFSVMSLDLEGAILQIDIPAFIMFM